MNIFSSLREKPWEAGPQPLYTAKETSATQLTGVKVMLAVISVLFFLFIVAFLMRSQYDDWQPLAEQADQPLYDRTQLWINTFYLIFASVSMHISYKTLTSPNSAVTRIALIAGGAFCTAFVIGQLLFWQSLYSQGFYVNLNPALSFFYLFTGLHALHVLVAILLWLLLINAYIGRAKGSEQATKKLHHYVKLTGLYWHFLLALWALLFALLISKPETYNAIVEFCGLGGLAP